MSLTSLADAPLLSKPAVGPGLAFPRSRPRPEAKLKDQAAIDALFQEEDNGIQGELHVERKNIPPSRETPNSARNLDTIFNTGEVDIPTQYVVSLPTLLPFNQQNVDSAKNSRQPKQDGAVFSKSKDPHDVLAGFLADNSTDLNVNECGHLEEEKKSQRDEFKSKWNTYSPPPPGRLPTLAYSPRHSLESTVSVRDVSHSSTSPNKTEDDHMVSSKKDERWDTIEDVLSLLPDESRKSSDKVPFCENASSAVINSTQNLDEEKSEFGEYRPSCLSLSKSNHAIQRRHLNSFFSSSESLDSIKKKSEISEKKLFSSISSEGSIKQVDMLQNMHMRELEARDQQLRTERALLAEKMSAMEAFSQLLLKADEWSAKIDQLHKSMVCEKEPQITERPKWIVNIESMASEHESSLQVLEKRSTEVCSQLEKVATTLEYARKDMEKLQNQEEERMNKTHDQLQALQEILQSERGQSLDVGTASREKLEQIHNLCSQEEKTLLSKFLEERKNLEVEREAVLLMKEQISQVDAALRKQLFEHAFRMQTEAEEMARQKSELEHAKEIAAEIALEVESSRQELEMYKTALNKTIPEAHGKDLHDEGFPEAHIATKRVFNLGRKEETVEVSRRWDQFRRPCCSADLSIDSLHGLDLLSRIESPQPEGLMMREEEKDMCYIKAQEEFLIQAEKDLENMECTSLDEIYMPRLLSF